MYLASFYNSAVKNNKVGKKKNGKEIEFSETDFMIWRFLCSLRGSNSRQVSTRVSADSESAPAARSYTLLICARFHGRRATRISFHKEITERDKWRHVCIWEQLLLLPTPHSNTHTNTHIRTHWSDPNTPVQLQISAAQAQSKRNAASIGFP